MELLWIIKHKWNFSLSCCLALHLNWILSKPTLGRGRGTGSIEEVYSLYSVLGGHEPRPNPVLSLVQRPPLPFSPAAGKDPALPTSPIPLHWPPGASAGLTAHVRKWRWMQRTPPGSDVGVPWTTNCPTEAWGAQHVNMPGSIWRLRGVF